MKPRPTIDELRDWAKREIERSRKARQSTASVERMLRDLTVMKLRGEVRSRKRKSAA